MASWLVTGNIFLLPYKKNEKKPNFNVRELVCLR